MLIVVRCIVQNTGNQDAHRIGWIWSQIRGKNEGYISEIKENVQGTNYEGKETKTQINGVNQKEERNIHLEQNKEQEFKKMRRGLGTSRITLNVPTSEL